MTGFYILHIGIYRGCTDYDQSIIPSNDFNDLLNYASAEHEAYDVEDAYIYMAKCCEKSKLIWDMKKDGFSVQKKHSILTKPPRRLFACYDCPAVFSSKGICIFCNGKTHNLENGPIKC
jgi:hypothetical protein